MSCSGFPCLVQAGMEEWPMFALSALAPGSYAADLGVLTVSIALPASPLPAAARTPPPGFPTPPHPSPPRTPMAAHRRHGLEPLAPGCRFLSAWRRGPQPLAPGDERMQPRAASKSELRKQLLYTSLDHLVFSLFIWTTLVYNIL